MQAILETLATRARREPLAPALTTTHETLGCRALRERIQQAADEIRAQGPDTIALFADNGIDWVVADLAAAACSIPLVPVPPFFTAAQVSHLLRAAAVDMLATPDAASAQAFGAVPTGSRIGSLGLFRRHGGPVTSVPEGTAKITFTSGSTGEPRGVCLSAELLDTVSSRLCSVVADLGVRRHLCSMPLATLLENVAGIYVPLMLGATVVVPPLGLLGLYGSSRIDMERFRAMLEAGGAESLVLQPQVLRELTATLRANPAHTQLKFVAVGGAKVAAADIHAARAAGIPACQGYGLSECASVVALNRPGSDEPGSVGRPLPGARVEIAADGEIIVHDQAMSGYLGEAGTPQAIATGDLGHFDDRGHLFVTGRKKNVFITSYGRNVSPEWPESELQHQPGIAQACVVGEARPYNTAILVIDAERLPDRDVAAAVRQANANLPDYACITDWVLAEGPFTPANGFLTATGKLRRAEIAERYLPAVRAAAAV